jgi:hypothetical protein
MNFHQKLEGRRSGRDQTQNDSPFFLSLLFAVRTHETGSFNRCFGMPALRQPHDCFEREPPARSYPHDPGLPSRVEQPRAVVLFQNNETLTLRIGRT